MSDAGSFLVGGLEHTSYVVLVMEGERVLHQEIVRTHPAGRDVSKLSIKLGGSR